ncbi:MULTISPECIES: hypothetical protein [unclassified Thiocapsa]|uniref:hypothetical protein n=1 Tax=unclassified Thiocapsa TaxID=2641286 RepID=UPI0035B10BEE
MGAISRACGAGIRHCENRPPARPEQLACCDDQGGDGDDEADQPQNMAVVAFDQLVESTVELLEALVDLLETVDTRKLAGKRRRLLETADS